MHISCWPNTSLTRLQRRLFILEKVTGHCGQRAGGFRRKVSSSRRKRFAQEAKQHPLELPNSPGLYRPADYLLHRRRRVRAFSHPLNDLGRGCWRPNSAWSYRLNGLTVANRVHILEPQWNPAAEKQAIGRLLRLDQSRKVTIVRYAMEKSIEQV